MLSRVADSLYWMGRYIERAEHTARLVNVELQLWLDQSPEMGAGRWRFLLEALNAPAADGPVDPTKLVNTLVFSRSNASSIVSCIASARENLRHVREQSSTRMWEQLNRLYLDVMDVRPEDDWILKSHDFFQLITEGAYLFHGITDATMSHGEGWQFIQLGKYMERSCALPVLLNAYFSTAGQADDLDWVGLLASCSAFESYCKVYTADLKPESIAEFLLLNPEFPYCVRYAVERMNEAIAAISERSFGHATTRLERIAGRLRASLAYAQITEIMTGGLHRYLDSVIEQCKNLHAAVHEVYIDYPIQSALEA